MVELLSANRSQPEITISLIVSPTSVVARTSVSLTNVQPLLGETGTALAFGRGMLPGHLDEGLDLHADDLNGGDGQHHVRITNYTGAPR